MPEVLPVASITLASSPFFQKGSAAWLVNAHSPTKRAAHAEKLRMTVGPRNTLQMLAGAPEVGPSDETVPHAVPSTDDEDPGSRFACACCECGESAEDGVVFTDGDGWCDACLHDADGDGWDEYCESAQCGGCGGTVLPPHRSNQGATACLF